MALMRTYSLVKEGGKIYIPSNFWAQIGLAAGSTALIEVVRIKRSIRAPHLVIHRKDNSPWISPQELVIKQEISDIDQEGNISLGDNIIEETKFKSGHLVEMKVYGPHLHCSWLIIHSRGPKIESTLQQKMRKYRPGDKESKPTGGKTWESIPLDY